jgi:hypothetical protein
MNHQAQERYRAALLTMPAPGAGKRRHHHLGDW